ncbi:hypothetical protein ON010_g6805 [Phytophthora cinnamomi]|nr:hypothetical protein ON010_g6805 [Phytophthora cinnamomi]
MSLMHGACILLMLSGSLWHHTLAFSPWSNSSSGPKRDEIKTDSTNSAVLESFMARVINQIYGRYGFCGVNGAHFHEIFLWREIIETTFQTVQAYRMSALLPRTVLNRFYVLLLAANCWSSIIIYSTFRKRGEAQKRLACVACDCVLDLVACMGIVLIIVSSYAGDYNRQTQSFDEKYWFNDEWLARALNEFQMVVVVSWSDLASRLIMSLGLIVATTDMKALVRYLPRGSKRISQSPPANASDVDAVRMRHWARKRSTVGPQPIDMRLNAPIVFRRPSLKHRDSNSDMAFRTRTRHRLLHAAHLLFGAWGLAVLGFHIHATFQRTLPQCLMQVRPWAVSRPACYLAGLDCHFLGISGTAQEVEDKWSEFDAATVVQLFVRHCPALEIPDLIGNYNHLRGIKVYNSTIITWGESAAITNTNHPDLTYMSIVRVNMTDGLLPAGFKSSDFPQKMNDIEFCVTNLREIPDDLDKKWPLRAIIQVEYSQLSELPLVLTRLQPYYLFVTGNPITELPPEFFEIEGMVYLGVSGTNIRELPQNVTHVYPALVYVGIINTNVSIFWSWVDELVGRLDSPAIFDGGGSTYCNDLENDTMDNHPPVSLPSEYSAILMNLSKANLQTISHAVDCNYAGEEPLYPLAFDDNANALQPPPPLPRHGRGAT